MSPLVHLCFYPALPGDLRPTEHVLAFDVTASHPIQHFTSFSYSVNLCANEDTTFTTVWEPSGYCVVRQSPT
eukprot:scaffold83_cov181-Amphora_coffeaeformis.AAC.29